jgi:hypothetical protein
MSDIDFHYFKKIYGDGKFEKLCEEIGEIKSCIEYENFYSLGFFAGNPFIAQVYKNDEIYENVYESYKKIIKSPIVSIEIEYKNKKEKMDINYLYYMAKIKYFNKSLNAVIFEPYIESDNYNIIYDELKHNDRYVISWRYYVIREGLKSIGININTPEDISNFSINEYGFVYINYSTFKIEKDTKFSFTIKDFVVNYLNSNRYTFKAGMKLLNNPQRKDSSTKWVDNNLKFFNDIVQDSKVIKGIKIFKPCNKFKIKNFDTKKIKSHVISKMLENDFGDYNKMQAISCLVISALKSISSRNDEDLPSKEIQNWLTNIKSIASGAQGNVYFANLFLDTFPVAFKLSRESKIKQCLVEQYFDFRAEYFKSFRGVNSLREFVPTFMYTFALFHCNVEIEPTSLDLDVDTLCLDKNPKQPFVLTERIKGKTIVDAIDKKELKSGKDFLIIYQQILLSLEVAQREISFAHFDLHGNNLILMPVPDGYTYSVLIDNKKISIVDPKFIPVFIDFGFACCNINEEQYGKFKFECYKTFNFLVPCTDYLKILLSCFYYGVESLNSDICDMIAKICNMKVMNNDLLNSRAKMSNILLNRNMYDSIYPIGNYASKTPLELLESIQANIGCDKVLIEERTEYKINTLNNVSRFFHELYRQDDGDNDFVSDIINENKINNFSFISTVCSEQNIKKYSLVVASNRLQEYLEKIKNILKNNQDLLIDYDNEILEQVFEMELPDEKEFIDESNYLLKLNILSMKDTDFYHIENMKRMILKFKEMDEYMDYFYKIQEFRIFEFNEWKNKFIRCENYKYYNKNIQLYNKMKRWCDTLTNALNLKHRIVEN